jgi:hypothetical protein
MINPSELRFGNYVIVKNYDSKYWNKIGQVEAFTRNAEYVSLDINQNSAFYLKDIEPILLTEEILIKCGFGKWLGLYSQNTFTLSTDNHIEYEHTQTSVKIKYLHELQNIYFAIKNEELTIQL